ncbi:MAG: hypothetical protein ChlgKO_10100 [Chlamydiales bacterium]
MPTPIQPNQPSSVPTLSFLGKLFASKPPERKNVHGITYSIAEPQPEAKPTRSVPNIPSPSQPMRSSLLGLVKKADAVIDTTTKSSSSQVERTVCELQEKEKQQIDQIEQDNPSSFNGYTIAATVAATAGFVVHFATGDRPAALIRTLPGILSIFSQASGAVGQMHMGKIQAEEVQHSYDIGLSRDNLDRTQTSLSVIMEGLTKSLERYMEMARQQADLIRQLNTRGF